MCGICGIFHFRRDRPVSTELLHDMTALLEHRGPDDSGVFTDTFVGLGHRRLSIIDLSGGRQPMTNEDGTVWVSYNGEIYNFRELRKDLVSRGHQFKTNCDTEVIVHAYEEYGPDCVLRFNGMFAFAIWDANRGRLVLARDRLGIKPLYYTVAGGAFLFASEVKALLEHPDVTAAVDVNSVPEYLFCTSFLGNNTMFHGIAAVPAGHLLIVSDDQPDLRQYWEVPLAPTAEDGGTEESYASRIARILDDAVELRLMSDVPFGSLLSGGLDSSLVSALATRHVHERLTTFSMEYARNVEMNRHTADPHFARLVADAFHTNHHEFLFASDEYNECLEKVTWHLEKPVELTTPSLYLLHKHLKEHVTVVLSGEGADELFGGYFFFLEEAQTHRLTEFPWAPYFREVSGLLSDDVARQTNFRDRVQTGLDDLLRRFPSNDFVNRVLALFVKIYLLEMLERQDKTSMAWGVEARVPFMDHRLVELVVNIPSQLKAKGDEEKYILKRAFDGLLPAAVSERKKKAFPFPVDPQSVYRQRNMANDLVQSGSSRIAQYFDKKKTDDFFRKRNAYANLDSLAVFRTSHSMIALELWHKAFGL